MILETKMKNTELLISTYKTLFRFHQVKIFIILIFASNKDHYNYFDYYNFIMDTISLL